MPLQKSAVRAAVDGKSILAVFPTGGGKFKQIMILIYIIWLNCGILLIASILMMTVIPLPTTFGNLAKSQLIRKYSGSNNNLQGVFKLLRDFEETHNKTKYKSDIKLFIRESKLEDFISESEGTILVFTIHQTKGREFDNVFLALSRFPKMDDETKRAIYVAFTRAKRNLYIFSNGNYFDNVNTENIKRFSVNNIYPEPSRICLQLSHKDVFLSYFTNRRREIDSLMSGQELSINDTGCFKDNKQIIKFSTKFSEKIDTLKAEGYIKAKAYVRHIVYWQGKDNDKEIKIILPNIEFSKDI